MVQPTRGSGMAGLQFEGGKLGETHRGWLPLLAEFLAQIPHPLCKDLPDLLTLRRVGTPAITCPAHGPHQPARSRSCHDANRA
jgi:hypothetical protein